MRRLLLIDDDPVYAKLIGDALKYSGSEFQLICKQGGKAGLEWLAAEADLRQLLVLLDLQMPGMSGAEVLAAIRANKRTHALPVAMLTGSGNQGDRAKTFLLGADTYLDKPVMLNQINSMFRGLAEMWTFYCLPDEPSGGS